MAETWENLALERADLVNRHPELAFVGEEAEEAIMPEDVAND